MGKKNPLIRQIANVIRKINQNYLFLSALRLATKSPNTEGTKISATTGDIFLVIMSAMKVAIISAPIKARKTRDSSYSDHIS